MFINKDIHSLHLFVTIQCFYIYLNALLLIIDPSTKFTGGGIKTHPLPVTFVMAERGPGSEEKTGGDALYRGISMMLRPLLMFDKRAASKRALYRCSAIDVTAPFLRCALFCMMLRKLQPYSTYIITFRKGRFGNQDGVFITFVGKIHCYWKLFKSLCIKKNVAMQ